jgi:hypothetical protein
MVAIVQPIGDVADLERGLELAQFLAERQGQAELQLACVPTLSAFPVPYQSDPLILNLLSFDCDRQLGQHNRIDYDYRFVNTIITNP